VSNIVFPKFKMASVKLIQRLAQLIELRNWLLFVILRLSLLLVMYFPFLDLVFCNFNAVVVAEKMIGVAMFELVFKCC
jgi:hypothetical protein